MCLVRLVKLVRRKCSVRCYFACVIQKFESNRKSFLNRMLTEEASDKRPKRFTRLEGSDSGTGSVGDNDCRSKNSGHIVLGKRGRGHFPPRRLGHFVSLGAGGSLCGLPTQWTMRPIGKGWARRAIRGPVSLRLVGNGFLGGFGVKAVGFEALAAYTASAS